MNSRGLAFCVLTAAMALPAPVLAGCDVRSGPNTAALIELYTSEGCSSCPPADRQLRQLRETLAPGAEAVPIALHVSYWDYIGWKDPYAQSGFDQRQSWLGHANGQRTIYTPEFFVGGAELRSWRSGLRERVRQLNATPALADIHLQAGIAPDGKLALDAAAKTREEAATLYLALAENGLVSNVTRGENGGATLQHDHVVRAWIGPIRFNSGTVRVQREIALPAAWKRTQLSVIAFVQDARNGKVLQALAAQQCTAPNS